MGIIETPEEQERIRPLELNTGTVCAVDGFGGIGLTTVMIDGNNDAWKFGKFALWSPNSSSKVAPKIEFRANSMFILLPEKKIQQASGET